MTPFGSYLESLRRSRRLKQKQLAALLQVNACYVSAMESGKKGPPGDRVLQRLIESLALNADESNKLWEYVDQSQRTFRLPDDMALEEYALASHFRKRLGSLDKNQIAAIDAVLRMGQASSEAMNTGGISA